MDLTTGYSMTLPIFQAEVRAGSVVPIPTALVGTCFALGDTYMITAGHVAATTTDVENRVLVVGVYRPDNKFDIARVIDIEPLTGDVAILRVHFESSQIEGRFNRFRWNETPLNPFTQVRSVGYAYGVHNVEEQRFTIVRGFEGHIVSRLAQFKPLGMSGAAFGVYELSFGAPRGLSGSPLLNAQGTVTIHGVVIGNSQSRMMVFREEERVQTGQTRIVEQYEMLTLGVAVTASEILAQESELLEGTIRNHLTHYGLIDEST